MSLQRLSAFFVPVGALFAVFGFLFSRPAAVRPRDILLLFGFGFHLVVFLFAAWATFAKSHSAALYNLVDVHVNAFWC